MWPGDVTVPDSRMRGRGCVLDGDAHGGSKLGWVQAWVVFLGALRVGFGESGAGLLFTPV